LFNSLEISKRFNIYAYDAYFIECSKNFNIPLISLDKKLIDVAKKLNLKIIEV